LADHVLVDHVLAGHVSAGHVLAGRGLTDHWRRILRWWNIQVNETREVGGESKDG
jgi:hypothetical protein